MSRTGKDTATGPGGRVKLRPRTIYLLNQINQAVRMELEAQLRDIGLTGIQYTVLAIVGGRREVSSAELSRRFFVTPQTMNEIVTGLEKRALIERQPSEANRRVLVANLTSEGSELLVRADAIADEVEGSAVNTLGDQDFIELRRLLGLMLGNIRSDREAAAIASRKQPS